MQRITIKDLERLCDRLNDMTGSPMKPYERDENGKLVAQIGNFHLSQAYGGVCLHRMQTEGGGVYCPIVNYHAPKRELFDRMHAFLDGMEFANREATN